MVLGGNDIGWRCEYPALAVGARTEIIPEDYVNTLLWYPHDRGPFRWFLRAHHLDGRLTLCMNNRKWKQLCKTREQVPYTTLVCPDHQGTAIWVLPCLSRAVMAKAMRTQMGVRTLAEVDDNYLANPKHSLFLRAAEWNRHNEEQHLKAMCSMNGIVFSTARLRDMYAKKIKEFFGKLPHLEYHVCHNNVPSDCWPTRIERDGPVRVGWMGSPSHVWDVDLAWASLMHAKNLGAETWMIGYDPTENPFEQTNPHNKDVPRHPRSLEKIEAWQRVGFKHQPWRIPAKYERLPLPLDIGLCPLLTNGMTLGKSDVKFIEYTISGAATIAMNNPVYNKTIVHGETGLLVGSPQEMLEATELLIKDEKLRERLVANAQQYVREERSEKQLKEEWETAING